MTMQTAQQIIRARIATLRSRASNCRHKAKHGGFDANKTNALINSAEAREQAAQILEDHLLEFDELKNGKSKSNPA
jgi:hypothetical protein